MMKLFRIVEIFAILLTITIFTSAAEIAVLAEDEIQTDSVTVVGQHQRPGMAPKRAEMSIPKTETLDPGTPDQEISDAEVAPSKTNDSKASSPVDGAPGRAKDSKNVPWWILIVIGGIAAALI